MEFVIKIPEVPLRTPASEPRSKKRVAKKAPATKVAKKSVKKVAKKAPAKKSVKKVAKKAAKKR
jgi:hypothetical protein